MNTADTLAPVRLGPELNGMPMTPEEFDAVEEWDEDHRYELVRGVLIVTPRAGIGERKPNDELGYLLYVYRDSHPREPLSTTRRSSTRSAPARAVASPTASSGRDWGALPTTATTQ